MSPRRQADDGFGIDLDKLHGVLHPELTEEATARQQAEAARHVPRTEREPQPSVICPTCHGEGRVLAMLLEPRLGALLWRARQDKRLTQLEVAAELGVTQATISRLEREGDDRGGRRYARQLLAYADFLGVAIPAAQRGGLEEQAAPPVRKKLGIPGRRPKDKEQDEARRVAHAEACARIGYGRERLMISQKTLSQRIGKLRPPRIPQSRLSRLERGELWAPDELERIQHVLDHVAERRGGWAVVEQQYRVGWRSQAWRSLRPIQNRREF